MPYDDDAVTRAKNSFVLAEAEAEAAMGARREARAYQAALGSALWVELDTGEWVPTFEEAGSSSGARASADPSEEEQLRQTLALSAAEARGPGGGGAYDADYDAELANAIARSLEGAASGTGAAKKPRLNLEAGRGTASAGSPPAAPPDVIDLCGSESDE